jgi:hypothetical protein
MVFRQEQLNWVVGNWPEAERNRMPHAITAGGTW